MRTKKICQNLTFSKFLFLLYFHRVFQILFLVRLAVWLLRSGSFWVWGSNIMLFDRNDFKRKRLQYTIIIIMASFGLLFIYYHHFQFNAGVYQWQRYKYTHTQRHWLQSNPERFVSTVNTINCTVFSLSVSVIVFHVLMYGYISSIPYDYKRRAINVTQNGTKCNLCSYKSKSLQPLRRKRERKK